MLLNSKLPVEVLGLVWELSDIDKDGCLDRDEFAVVGISREWLHTISFGCSALRQSFKINSWYWLYHLKMHLRSLQLTCHFKIFRQVYLFSLSFQAMYLVYRALESGEPVPKVLPDALIPPTKRRKTSIKLAGSVPVLPSLPVGDRTSPNLVSSSPILNKTVSSSYVLSKLLQWLSFWNCLALPSTEMVCKILKWKQLPVCSWPAQL